MSIISYLILFVQTTYQNSVFFFAQEILDQAFHFPTMVLRVQK